MGCAAIGHMYDLNDDCQVRPELGRPQGYKPPDWCGASQGRKTIYNRQGQPMGWIK